MALILATGIGILLMCPYFHLEVVESISYYLTRAHMEQDILLIIVLGTRIWIIPFCGGDQWRGTWNGLAAIIKTRCTRPIWCVANSRSPLSGDLVLEQRGTHYELGGGCCIEFARAIFSRPPTAYITMLEVFASGTTGSASAPMLPKTYYMVWDLRVIKNPRAGKRGISGSWPTFDNSELEAGPQTTAFAHPSLTRVI